MSFRTIIVVGLALACGLAAAVGVDQLRSQTATAAAVGSVSVVSAAVDIPRGVMVTRDLLKLVEMPEGDIPAGVVTDIEDALDRAVVIPLLRDDLIRDGKLAAKDAGRGMAALVPTGMRAYTIMTPTIASGVGGFILPGNKVDVVLSVTERSLDDVTGGGSATTLLQNVEILAVDQTIDAPMDNKIDPQEMRSVTLLVMPDQANKLSLAQDKGTLHLSLRNDDDGLAADTRPVSLRDLRFQQEGPTEVAEAPEGVEAQVVGSLRPKPLRIRTLRGRHSGLVPLQPFVVNGE